MSIASGWNPAVRQGEMLAGWQAWPSTTSNQGERGLKEHQTIPHTNLAWVSAVGISCRTLKDPRVIPLYPQPELSNCQSFWACNLNLPSFHSIKTVLFDFTLFYKLMIPPITVYHNWNFPDKVTKFKELQSKYFQEFPLIALFIWKQRNVLRSLSACAFLTLRITRNIQNRFLKYSFTFSVKHSIVMIAITQTFVFNCFITPKVIQPAVLSTQPLVWRKSLSDTLQGRKIHQ